MSISNGGQFIRKLKEVPEYFYIIHYSCQSLYDDNEGLSPRITSIAVSHFATGQTVSFSTHAVAESLGIERNSVRERFDDIELELLSDFYEFVRDRRDRYWIHWNMRNLTYGFEHLEHRFLTLGGNNPLAIPVERRINLNDMIKDRYGDSYVPNPKMQSLMELNGGLHRNYLTGLQEVEAFNNCEFIRMHSSTLSKVEFFGDATRAMIGGKLQTKSKDWGVKLDKLFESRFAKIVGFLGALFTVLVVLWQVAEWLAP